MWWYKQKHMLVYVYIIFMNGEMRTMELLQLQYFCVVANLEHMTKAAEELNVAQPALSATIARLEKELGVPLFDRQGRTIRLNTFGKAFLKKAQSALALLEEGRREVADLAGLERGSIYMVTSTIDRLSEPLAAFRAIHPEINFRITQASMAEMGELLEHGEIDFCFSPFPIEQTGVQQISIMGEEIMLGVGQGHPLANRTSIQLREVANEAFICYKEGHPFRKINDGFCREAGFQRKVICEVEEPAAIGSLVKAGLGIAFIGYCDPDDSIVRITIQQPHCVRSFHMAWLENRYLSKAAHTFKDFITDYFAELQKSYCQGAN